MSGDRTVPWAKWLAAFALVASLLVAFAARRAADPSHSVVPFHGEGKMFLVDDADASYQLRRVQLALAGGEVPLFDRYLNHPEGSAVPWPPAFAGALALAVQMALPKDPYSHPSSGGYSEAEIERFLAQLPPWLGLTATAAVALALFGLVRRGGSRLWPAALAAWCFASLPIAVWYGSSGRIDHHVAVQLCLALELGLMGVCLRTEESLDALAFALVGGLVAGLLLLLAPANLWIVGLVGAALFAAAASQRGELAAARRRAGLLFFAAATAAVLVPAEASPWNEVQRGSLVQLSLGVPRALLGACLPFVALEVGARFGWKRGPAALGALLVAAATVALLPGLSAGLRDAFDGLGRGDEFAQLDAENRPLFGWGAGADFGAAFADLGLLGFLFPLLCIALAVAEMQRRRWYPERWLLIAVAALCFASTLHQRRFGDALSVPLCLVAAVAVHDLLAARWGKLLAGGLAAVLVLSAAPSLWARFTVSEDDHRAQRQYRGEMQDALLWMRTETASPGPWNAPNARQDYGVLAPFELGHAIVYQARRPAIATPFGLAAGERGFRGAAAALLLENSSELERRMLELDADYVVLRARDVSDLVSYAEIAGWDAEARAELRGTGFSARARSTALWQLGAHDLPVGSAAPGFDGLELVHRTEGTEGIDGTPPGAGAPTGPRLSIWRRAASAQPDRIPSLAPPPR